MSSRRLHEPGRAIIGGRDKVRDVLLSIMLLGGEFENFTVAVQTRDALPDVSDLRVKLLEGEAR